MKVKGIEDRSKTKAARYLEINSLKHKLDELQYTYDSLKSNYDSLSEKHYSILKDSNEKIHRNVYSALQSDLRRCRRHVEYIESKHNLTLSNLQYIETELNNARKNYSNLRWINFWLFVIIAIIAIINLL